MHLLCDGQRAVAAHGHERLDAECLHAALRVIQQFLGQLTRLAVARLGGEGAAIGGAQNRAAAHQQPVQRLVIQHLILLRRQQPLIAADDAESFPSAFGARLGDGANDRVQSGAIAPAGNNSNLHTSSQ